MKRQNTRTIIVLLVVIALLLSMTSVALATQPPGQKGYESQPGNQGGHRPAKAARYWSTPTAYQAAISKATPTPPSLDWANVDAADGEIRKDDAPADQNDDPSH